MLVTGLVSWLERCIPYPYSGSYGVTLWTLFFTLAQQEKFQNFHDRFLTFSLAAVSILCILIVFYFVHFWSYSGPILLPPWRNFPWLTLACKLIPNLRFSVQSCCPFSSLVVAIFTFAVFLRGVFDRSFFTPQWYWPPSGSLQKLGVHIGWCHQAEPHRRWERRLWAEGKQLVYVAFKSTGSYETFCVSSCTS